MGKKKHLKNIFFNVFQVFPQLLRYQLGLKKVHLTTIVLKLYD